ncbi:MAG: hypothetical protein AAGH78_00175 [Cyanobacteria bacterium P01_H01_bin.58]
MSDELVPEDVQTWFPPKVQQRYIERITAQSAKHPGGCGILTEVQARHLVRLWGYGYLKDYGLEHAPIKSLNRKVSRFVCTYAQAATLFYADREKLGNARSADEMLKKLASKGLIQCSSSQGSPTQISLNIRPDFELPLDAHGADVYIDKFDPRNDAPTVANFLKGLYVYDAARVASLERDITRGLRQWAKAYPEGLRVLRQQEQSKAKAIALAAIFPVHPESEIVFDQPPSDSLYLGRFKHRSQDSIRLAELGDPECHVAYIRAWHIKPGLWDCENVLKLVDDNKTMLRKMQQEYPELSDVYSILIHPRLADLATTLGFEVMGVDPRMALSWIYMPLDHFLDLDAGELLRDFDFGPHNRWGFT